MTSRACKDFHLWHARLGHPSLSSMKFLPAGMYFCEADLNKCDTCHLAKQTRLVFPKSQTTSTELFDLVHMDVWGPYKYKTHGYCGYFLTIVEDKSRSTWTYLFADKSQVPSIILAYLAYVSTQFHNTIKAVRTDNGSEFINLTLKTEFSKLGIQHQTNCTYSPQQNGIVERKHRTLLNVARALRFQAHLPISFWGDYLLTTTYLLNITPILFSMV